MGGTPRIRGTLLYAPIRVGAAESHGFLSHRYFWSYLPETGFTSVLLWFTVAKRF